MRKVLICIPIVGPSIAEAEEQLRRAVKMADMIELRFDLIEAVSSEVVEGWQRQFPLPMIFKAPTPELIALAPAYVDIELPPETKLIASRHTEGAIYKLAVHGKHSIDALRIAMGDDGIITRVRGNPWTYCALDAPCAPGQLTIEEARDLYRVREDRPRLYAVIGDPVVHSLGPQEHNPHLEDGIYVRLRLRSHELEEGLDRLRQLNLGGLSVTMPLKQAIIPYLDRIETSVGAVNTVCVEGDQLVGYNTDGEGVCDLIDLEPGAHAVIIGAGGAARAVAYALRERGVRLTILNRSATPLAQEVGATLQPLGKIPACDLVVQTTPLGLQWEFTGSPTVVEMSYMAPKHPAVTIDGEQVFRAQARRQRELWHAR